MRHNVSKRFSSSHCFQQLDTALRPTLCLNSGPWFVPNLSHVNQSHKRLCWIVYCLLDSLSGYGQHSLTEMIQGLGFQERKDLKVLWLLVWGVIVTVTGHCHCHWWRGRSSWSRWRGRSCWRGGRGRSSSLGLVCQWSVLLLSRLSDLGLTWEGSGAKFIPRLGV